MDRHTLGVLIPVIGVFFTGLVVFSFTSLGRAIARRIERGGGAELDERMAQLESEQSRLRDALLEAHERLDYTERLLAQESAPPRMTGR